jgi:HK97 family phage major capsid protein
MGHQFALKEDEEAILGDGTSTYGMVQGIRNAIALATASIYTPTDDHDSWDELTLADHFGAMSLLADKYRGLPLSWLCSGPYKWQVFDRLSLSQGGTVPSDVVNGMRVPTFLGYPVVVSDRMPTSSAVSQVSAIFGAFENAGVIGERAGIRIAVSEHVAFTSHRIAVRGTTRYDINVHEAGDTTTAGAIVGLATHS